MRTSVYVDGCNLYYGALKGTAYKWLDLERLMQVLLPFNEVTAIKFFTARVRGRPQDPASPERQNVYLRALEAHCPTVEIIHGYFLIHHIRMPLSHPPEEGRKTVDVVQTTEKRSDVNLAVSLVDDAWRDRYDTAVVVSNDSDLAFGLERARALGKTIGLITPTQRRASKQLAEHADFRKALRANHLTQAQLPKTIPGTKLTRPDGW
ncbi:NYN domain-containing protein [uncultured Maricaulis sp.]|mgnify:CR=1 FL=1|uniref:NYN domain-containing protein n=1 Tax=uncultured Maricaulis sp. TaxID=174710 RepID=UPI0030DA2757